MGSNLTLSHAADAPFPRVPLPARFVRRFFPVPPPKSHISRLEDSPGRAFRSLYDHHLAFTFFFLRTKKKNKNLVSQLLFLPGQFSFFSANSGLCRVFAFSRIARALDFFPPEAFGTH